MNIYSIKLYSPEEDICYGYLRNFSNMLDAKQWALTFSKKTGYEIKEISEKYNSIVDAHMKSINIRERDFNKERGDE